MLDRLAATLNFETPVTSVAGVSSHRATELAHLGVRSVRDLLMHFPRRYLDMSKMATIGSAAIGQNATIVATVHEVIAKRPKPKVNLVEVTLVDGTGTMIVTFFRQPWLAKSLTPGTRVSVAGEVEFNYGFKRMTMPFLDRLDVGDEASAAKIIPTHPATGSLPSGQMRRLVQNALSLVSGLYDPLPLELRSKYRLMSRNSALRAIHFPHAQTDLAQARRRLIYEEVLQLELHLMMQQAQLQAGKTAPAHAVWGKASSQLKAALPFELTGDQKRAIEDISAGMQSSRHMQHMVLGDVGTGKTLVAAFALAFAADSSSQALMMGPTEVLVRQYGAALGPLFDEAGISWAVLCGSTPAEERASILEKLASGQVSVVFGTHALLEPDVVCQNCTLVIVDEEQRFGVEQRETLAAKGQNPDVLSMTATPIPRTLALALYGASTLSYIKEIPYERPPRTTKVYGFRERGKAYDAALAAVGRGEQVYVVCPLVGKKPKEDPDQQQKEAVSALDAAEDVTYIESDADMLDDNLRAAEAEAAFLQAKTFSEYKVGLLHGKMKPAEKRAVMEDFRNGAIQVLVSTTVIEVGVDVSNATVMIIEDADRFGLSQLHQLRGRVGRSSLASEVYLVAATSNQDALDRLSAMEQTDDGFQLAEFDLSLRREGDILGNRQHGASALRLVNVARDGAVINAAHEDACRLMECYGTQEEAEKGLKPLFREVETVFSTLGD